MRDYPGSCEGKRAARDEVYKYIKRAPKKGYGVMICGPDPSEELAAIKRIKWNADKLLVVDCVPHEALYNVVRVAPGARVLCSDAADALMTLPSVSWFNGDFCGFNKSVLRAVSACTERLLPGGVISLTWSRGRGSGVKDAARHIGDSNVDGIDRWVKVTAGLKGCKLKMDHYTQYNRSKGMSMGVGVWIHE